MSAQEYKNSEVSAIVSRWQSPPVPWLLVMSALGSAQGHAADADAALPAAPAWSTRYPAGSIQSVEIADAALLESGRERTAVEARYKADEHKCYSKFFATKCLDEAKERRRLALTRVRSVEIEANSFKRRERVVERDRALQQQRDQEQSEAPQRRKDQIEREATRADKAAVEAAEKKSRESNERLQRELADKRVTQHRIKLQRLQSEQAAEAKKRAENVSAYELKVRDAELHRRAVASKKAEKEQEKHKQDARSAPAACCVKP